MKVCVKKCAPRDVRPLKDHIKQIFACYFLLVNFVSVSNMENAGEVIAVNAVGPVEQPWTEIRLLEQLLIGVNNALNNSAKADPVTIANLGVNHFFRSRVTMTSFLEMKGVWTTWGLRKVAGRGGSLHYDFEFDRKDSYKLTDGIQQRYVFPLPYPNIILSTL